MHENLLTHGAEKKIVERTFWYLRILVPACYKPLALFKIVCHGKKGDKRLSSLKKTGLRYLEQGSLTSAANRAYRDGKKLYREHAGNDAAI